jgi:hypothetical protein
MTPAPFRTLSAKIDANGNVWIAVWRSISSTNRCAIYKISKTNTSVDEYALENRALLQTSAIISIDTFMDVAQNRLHVIYSQGQGNSGTELLIFNCSSNSLFVTPRTIQHGTTSVLNWNTKLVQSSAASKEVAIVTVNAGNGEFRLSRYTIDPLLSYGAETRARVNYTSLTSLNGSYDVFFDNSFGFCIVNFKTTNGLELIKIPANFSSSTLPSAPVSVINTLPLAAQSGSISEYVDNTHVFVTYIANDGSNSVYLSKMRISDGSISDANSVVQQKISTSLSSHNYPAFDFYNSVLNIFYTKDGVSANTSTPHRVQYGLQSTKMKVEAQMFGSTFVTIYDTTSGNNIDNFTNNNLITLSATANTQIRFRVYMESPTYLSSQVTPTFRQLNIFTPNSDPSAYSATYVSKSLINNKLISEVTLNADIETQTGSVTFEVSNNGGVNWRSISNNQTVSFTTVGSDLRLKSFISIPANAGDNVNSTRLHGFTVTTSNVAQQSDLVILNVNLMKTTLQLNTLLTSNRLGWTNMMVDTFQDGTGVTLNGVTLTNGTIAGTGTVTSAIETAEINPVNSIVIVAEKAGTTTFEVSRDGGLTWYIATPDTITVLDGNESIKNQIQIKANMTSGTLYGWAYLYA